MENKVLYITKEEGETLIRKLKTDSNYWNEFVRLTPAKNIFSAKMRACNIRKEYYDDMVMEMYIHLYRNNWAELEKIESPEKFWGWFSMKVRTYFGFYRDETTGEYKPKKALRELLHGGTLSNIEDIDATIGEDDAPKYQIPSGSNTEELLLKNERIIHFNDILTQMRYSGRKNFPVYVEVLERVCLKNESRTAIAVDLAQRGLIKSPAKKDGEPYSDAEKIKLRDNLNNNIYRRARTFFNEMALNKQYECQIYK